MNDRKFSARMHKVGLGLSAALLVTLTGCVAYVDRPSEGSLYMVPTVETTVVVQDDYVYYPSYQIYYSNSRHQYAYRDGRNWVSRPAPRGVSINRLQASPSVRMDFHDSPAQHHEAVVKQYPKNWKPAGENQGQKRNVDRPGDNHGK
jgi:hypothetical protein